VLGASSPVFFAMFYGPLAAPTTPGMPLLMGSSFAADMGNVVSAAEGQPSHKGESAAASRAASAMSNHGSGAGPQVFVGNCICLCTAC